jgi:hypothetical protein
VKPRLGVNVTCEVCTFRTYVPSTVVTVVAEQDGTLWSAAHSLSDEGSIEGVFVVMVCVPDVIGAGAVPGEDWVSGESTTAWLYGAADIAGFANGAGGGNTATCNSPDAVWPNESVTT